MTFYTSQLHHSCQYNTNAYDCNQLIHFDAAAVLYFFVQWLTIKNIFSTSIAADDDDDDENSNNQSNETFKVVELTNKSTHIQKIYFTAINCRCYSLKSSIKTKSFSDSWRRVSDSRRWGQIMTITIIYANKAR